MNEWLCRCCGADLSREGHVPSCENVEPFEAMTPSEQAFYIEDEEAWDPSDGQYERDDEGGPDFDPYAGCVIFDDGGEDF